MLGMKRGQGATEYLVLLAVVLIIALVSIALLGFFPGLAGDAKRTQSDAYWQGEARPVSIKEHKQTAAGTSLDLVVQNQESSQITVTALTLDGSGSLSNFTLAGGEKKAVTVTSAPTCGSSGSTYEYDVLVTYNTRYLTGLKQNGTKSLVGKCN